MEQQAARQPDFGRLASTFRDIGEQVHLFENIPALEGEVQLVRRMDEILRETRLLRTEVAVMNKNFTSRLGNSIVVAGEMALLPLYNITTGEEVSNCPETLAELERCDSRAAAGILQELGETVPRSLEQMIRQLKLTFGIRTRAM
ncbi:hypothetical protein ED733_004732 [Metarhizium rileyi]|uniref:Uncharacterized protein n=1 Tax=Metarhizium rileyi (strain RCEF 4871) TaxID=1649241 RepID=A0A5C6G9I8_METRR|nr:hypothetical protein ED733_004732 [Metarhizium rileyi]